MSNSAVVSTYKRVDTSDRARGKSVILLIHSAVVVSPSVLLAACSNGAEQIPTAVEITPTESIIKPISSIGRAHKSDSQRLETSQPSINKEKTTGTIEFSLFGITVKIDDLDSDEFKKILGVLVFLTVMQEIYFSYKSVQKNKITSKALSEAEMSFLKVITDLYENLPEILDDKTYIYVVSNGKETKLDPTKNLIESILNKIRPDIMNHWIKYHEIAHSGYGEAVKRLYQNTISNPSDISLIRSSVDDIRFIGKNKKLLKSSTINFLEKLSIQLSKAKG